MTEQSSPWRLTEKGKAILPEDVREQVRLAFDSLSPEERGSESDEAIAIVQQVSMERLSVLAEVNELPLGDILALAITYGGEIERENKLKI